MRIKRLLQIYFIIGLSIWVEVSFSQDTTYIDPKTEYFSKNGDSYEKLKTLKTFPRYSREKIQVSKDSFKIEYCYYFDNKRETDKYIRSFKITNDSIIVDDDLYKWSFKKVTEDIYRVTRIDSSFTVRGTARSIIPFVKNSDFVHYFNQDTLLIEHFDNGKYISTTTPKTKFKDSIYVSVDEMPKFPSEYGDLQTYISKRIIFPSIYTESTVQGKVYVRVVITSGGEIRNLEIIRGIDPELDNEALRIVSRLPEFIPAKQNGSCVNVYFIIPVRFAF